MSDRRTFQLPGSREGGVKCPECGCRHMPVWATRPEANRIKRTRRCRNCGTEIITYEMHAQTKPPRSGGDVH
jgi:DNA-directed RNA polymerase subunit RPC12/RpoP